MKGSKSFLFLSVLVAVLVLGIAYAAITANFTITSSATVAPDGSNFKVAITDVSNPTASEGVKLTNENGDSLVTAVGSGVTGTFTIAEGVLKTVGDEVTVTYTVTNSSEDLNAVLGEIKVEPVDANNEGNQYVSFTASYGKTGAENLTLAKDGTNTIVVKAKLVKAPSDTTVSASSTIKFTATAEEV